MAQLLADFGKGVVVNLTIFLFFSPILVPLFLWAGVTLTGIAVNVMISIFCLSVIELLFPESRENNCELADRIIEKLTGR